ncbi:MAG: hypothetical protein F6J98_32375 [Moorea sp. SIO4G2]|nr:hypothetical protein [Moorena sp. SIO4G2]
MPSVKSKTASIVAITALTVGLTPVLPAGAQQTNQSDGTGAVAAIFRGAITPNVIQRFTGNVTNTRPNPIFGGSGNNRINGLVRGRFGGSSNNSQPSQSAAAQLAQEIDSCVATGCNDLPNLLQEAGDLIQGLENSI